MSYILEALKKAEAERERSQVPGLSTAQGNSTIYITHQSNARAWWIAGGLAVLLVAVVGAWALRSTGATGDAVPVANSPQPTSPAVAAAPAQAPIAAPAPAATVAPAPLKPPSTKELQRTAVAPVVVGAAPSTKLDPLKAPAWCRHRQQPLRPRPSRPPRQSPALPQRPLRR